MSREIFIDASAWIMISDNRSKYFIEASEFYRHILQNNRLLVTTNLTVAESFVMIRKTGGHQKAMLFLDAIDNSKDIYKVYLPGST